MCNGKFVESVLSVSARAAPPIGRPKPACALAIARTPRREATNRSQTPITDGGGAASLSCCASPLLVFLLLPVHGVPRCCLVRGELPRWMEPAAAAATGSQQQEQRTERGQALICSALAMLLAMLLAMSPHGCSLLLSLLCSCVRSAAAAASTAPSADCIRRAHTQDKSRAEPHTHCSSLSDMQHCVSEPTPASAGGDRAMRVSGALCSAGQLLTDPVQSGAAAQPGTDERWWGCCSFHLLRHPPLTPRHVQNPSSPAVSSSSSSQPTLSSLHRRASLTQRPTIGASRHAAEDHRLTSQRMFHAAPTATSAAAAATVKR